MANVLFKRGNTNTINGTAITDGQLLYNTTTGQHYIDSGSTRKEVGKPVDTALSTTSTNAIANKALTKSIINTTAGVSAITANNIPCGTKPVKELIKNLNDWVDGIDVRHNASLSRAEWSVRGADTWTPFSKMPQQMYTSTFDGSTSTVPFVKWINNEFTISLYSTYYVAFDVRNFTKMKIKAFSRHDVAQSALFSDTTLNTTSSTSNTLVRKFYEPITSEIEIDISNYDFITLCAYGYDGNESSVRYKGWGGLFTGVSFE